jgi:hypothetical protein
MFCCFYWACSSHNTSLIITIDLIIPVPIDAPYSFLDHGSSLLFNNASGSSNTRLLAESPSQRFYLMGAVLALCFQV